MVTTKFETFALIRCFFMVEHCIWSLIYSNGTFSFLMFSLCPVFNDVQLLTSEIECHLADSRRGEILRSGVRVSIIGEPNVGKSSLLNLLCKFVFCVTPVTATGRRSVTATLVSGNPVDSPLPKVVIRAITNKKYKETLIKKETTIKIFINFFIPFVTIILEKAR